MTTLFYFQSAWNSIFSTKENGTGLGIPICYDIAEKNRALIDIEKLPSSKQIFII